MVETIKQEWQAKVAIVFFVICSVWWIVIYPYSGQSSFANYIFAGIYGLMALWGGFWGIRIGMKWGGFKSIIGKAILFLSLGLLAEEFGQIVFTSYYFVLNVAVPYPSLADVGFFGNIPLYILGITFLTKAAGSQFILRKLHGKLLALLLPVVLLVVSYYVFLQGYEFDWSNSLQVFLDFGYPLGQAIYISIALLTYLLSRNMLGGIMRSKILFIVVAFVIQYISDYNFLLHNSRGTWVNGAYGDYLYFLAYFFMTIGILQLLTVYKHLYHKE